MYNLNKYLQSAWRHTPTSERYSASCILLEAPELKLSALLLFNYICWISFSLWFFSLLSNRFPIEFIKFIDKKYRLFCYLKKKELQILIEDLYVAYKVQESNDYYMSFNLKRNNFLLCKLICIIFWNFGDDSCWYKLRYKFEILFKCSGIILFAI